MSGSSGPTGLADFSEMLARGADAPEPDPLDPATQESARRRRTRRRVAGLVVVLLIVAAVGTYLPVTLLAPLPTAVLTATKPALTVPAAVQLTLPAQGESAVSVTGAETFAGTVGTNGILASSGGPGPLPIASISKLITALVVLQAKPLTGDDAGPTLTFSKADHDLYDQYYVLGASVEPMKTGSTLSEHDALALMLVASACNYADAVSTWAFGSRARYLSAVKTWLSAHGLSGTTIVEPTGIDAKNVSTPSDLITIGKLAMANPTLASIVGSRTVDVPGVGAVPNNNISLGSEGIDGIKTGTLDSAGSCLLFSATVNVGLPKPITITGVILDGSSRETVNSDAQILIRSIESGFHVVTLETTGTVVGRYGTAWKDGARVVTGDRASVLTWSDAPISSTMTVRPLSITAGKTVTDGSTVGSLDFTVNGSVISVPLVLDGSISGPGGWWRLTHPEMLLGGH
ncbi:D-alanyl-D-alanine carboxypeptidase [Glaciihabitans sp. INWT7]|uniref:D-alanyl-D-alanine carboxypeptidase family protein n=1 Tax=Glaciihabitans sp. INWT7 TaxID=2596912 RepID=UPI0016241070|nr:D-alanyl-D-alanine carboxypeptidase [Glaciihabitans sp. INWT7]QNE47462.1 D-alanyl-D-alanine carboxypeptidase [Glaciihabitans sp. INWT7]